MKKVLITMCAAIAVLACTKTEVAFDEPNEIAFSPVSKFETKAAVASGASIGQDFIAWANTVPTTGASQAYFSDVLFTSPTDGVYVGSPTQYWPNATALKFAGVTKSGNIGASTSPATVSMTAWGTINVIGYTQPDPSVESTTNDLMWFFDDNTDDKGYVGDASTIVRPTASHACSWITVAVKLADYLVDTDNSKDGNQPYWTNVTVKNIKFETLKTTGAVTLGTSAAWTGTSGAQSNVVIYNNDTGVVVGDAAKTIENEENNVVVIPQEPTTLSMTYSYNTPATGSVTETVTGISLDYDGDEAWKPGKHYTYTLTIGADEIKIAPASDDWTSASGSGLTQDVK